METIVLPLTTLFVCLPVDINSCYQNSGSLRLKYLQQLNMPIHPILSTLGVFSKSHLFHYNLKIRTWPFLFQVT